MPSSFTGPGSEFLNYGIDNEDVQNHAQATANAIAPQGTLEHSAAYRKAMVEHAVNFGMTEGRDNAGPLAALAQPCAMGPRKRWQW